MRREFRPPIRRSAAPAILTAVLVVTMLLVGGVLGAIALGSNQVSYTLHAGVLTIDSGSLLDQKRSVPLASVTDARVVTVSRGRRVRGTGAPGLCTGWWWYPELGDVWQATDCSARGVVLQVTGEARPLLVSPPDPDGFVALVQAGTDAQIVLPPGDATVMHLVPGLGALALVVVTLMLALVFVFGPKRMRYVVADGELTIETIFSRRTFAARELRAREHLPKVTLRLAGTAFPGYYTGLFRADGVTTRVYATELRSPGVLIEGPARVLVSPADRAAFLEALEQAGATVERPPAAPA